MKYSNSIPVGALLAVSPVMAQWSTYDPDLLCSTTTTYLQLATPVTNPEELTKSLLSKYNTGDTTGAITDAGELVNVATLTATNGWGEPANGYYVAFESYLESEGFEIVTTTETKTSVCTHSLSPSPTAAASARPMMTTGTARILLPLQVPKLPMRIFPPSPTASVGCEPHGDHWHCEGPRETDAADDDDEAEAATDENLPPSPTASVGCEPHGDHWHCDGPRETDGADAADDADDNNSGASIAMVPGFLAAGAALAATLFYT